MRVHLRIEGRGSGLLPRATARPRPIRRGFGLHGAKSVLLALLLQGGELLIVGLPGLLACLFGGVVALGW